MFQIDKSIDLNDLLNSKGKVKPQYLKKLVDSYKIDTEQALETTNRKLYDKNTYNKDLCDDLSRMMNTQSIFTLIAENTMKYFAELSMSHSHRFNNDYSMLAIAGILDAQGYISQSRITFIEIIEISKKTVLVPDDSTLFFILSLIEKLLSLDNPQVPLSAVHEGIFKDKRQEIQKSINSVKEKYVSEELFRDHANQIMTDPEFKELRELLKIT